MFDCEYACRAPHRTAPPSFFGTLPVSRFVSYPSTDAFALFSSYSYGDSEIVTATVKILCFLGLIFVSLVITLGGAPNHDRVGFRYWNNPGALTSYNGITGSTGQFLGFFAAFINASFSFIGVETVVIAAAETKNPHRSIPKAVHRVTYRIMFFCEFSNPLSPVLLERKHKKEDQ